MSAVKHDDRRWIIPFVVLMLLLTTVTSFTVNITCQSHEATMTLLRQVELTTAKRFHWNFSLYFSSTHADRRGVDTSFTGFCLFFVCSFFVCLRISPPRIKLAASNSARRFIDRRPGQGISHFGECCSHRSPKSDDSATHPEVKFRVGRASVIACLSISRGVWT